jgi:hypothetical protein
VSRRARWILILAALGLIVYARRESEMRPS